MKLHAMFMLFMLIIAAMLPGCASGIPLTVTSIADPDAELMKVRTFDLARARGNDPLVEKNLLRIAEDELVARGYTRDTAQADILVVVLGDTAAQRETVPPSTSYTPVYDPGDTYTVTRKRTVNGSVVRTHERVRTPGDWYYIPHTTPGYERTVFRSAITIRFLEGSARIARESDFEAVPVWEARVTTTGGEPSLVKLAPAMIREALDEFPTPSGKASRRSVSCDDNQNAPGVPKG